MSICSGLILANPRIVPGYARDRFDPSKQKIARPFFFAAVVEINRLLLVAVVS